MFRKILVATDLTSASIPALRAALEMGRRFAAEIVAVHVTEPPYHNRSWYAPFEPSESELLEALSVRQREAAVRALEGQLDEARAGGHAGAVVRAIVKEGVPADEIPATALEIGADLIVVGTHGRKGAKHLLLGSIAEHIVRSASCPVLTVRPGEK